MTDQAITMKDLTASHMKERAHLNGGRDWFGYIHQCVEYPRLSRLDKYLRKNRSVESTWRVDGAPVADLGAAVTALNVPPVFTEDEQALLDRIPLEFSNLRKLEDELAGGARAPASERGTDSPHHKVMTLLHSLNDKGALEYGRDPGRSDGPPWSDAVPEHLRWSPTIRRRA